MFQHASQKHKHLSWRESYQTELRIYDALSLVLALAAAQALRFGWLQGLLQVDVLPVPYWLVGLLLAVGWWLWLELREECRRREGEDFDLTAFHRRALDIGGVGLDTLRAAVHGEL